MYKKKVGEDVLAVISSGIVEGNHFRITSGQLDRKTYLGVNEVLENIGGKWDRRAKAHTFEGDPTDKIEAVLLSGETIDEKQLYQFFQTPKELARRMVEEADIRDDMMVLEPSAGHGAIAEAIAAYDTEKPTYNVGLMLVEIDPKKCEVLEEKKIAPVICADFMGTFAEEYGEFDRVLMNPPFTRQQDVSHVTHAFERCLYPGGRLVAITSIGFTFRQDRKSEAFRDLVARFGRYEILPEDTFKESGTSVQTAMVVLDKPETAE